MATKKKIVLEGEITKVSVTTGKGKAGKWTRLAIRIKDDESSDEEWISSFVGSFDKRYEGRVERGDRVRAKCIKQGRYIDFTSLELLDDEESE